MLSELLGFNVGVFLEMDDAFEWLAAQPAPPPPPPRPQPSA